MKKKMLELENQIALQNENLNKYQIIVIKKKNN